MFKRVITNNINRRSVHCLYLHSKYRESTNINKLFGNDLNVNNNNHNIEIKQEILTRTDFGFYQRLLPIDTVQDMISSINFLFGLYF